MDRVANVVESIPPPPPFQSIWLELVGLSMYSTVYFDITLYSASVSHIINWRMNVTILGLPSTSFSTAVSFNLSSPDFMKQCSTLLEAFIKYIFQFDCVDIQIAYVFLNYILVAQFRGPNCSTAHHHAEFTVHQCFWYCVNSLHQLVVVHA